MSTEPRHLSASDEAVDEFIDLHALNRNMAILIDSDREAASDELKPHAKRLFEEMSRAENICWITAGREVENYIEGNKIQSALSAIHPKIYRSSAKTGRYDHAFYFMRENPKKPGSLITFKDGDKVGAATEICQSEANLDILDLRERVSELVAMIRKANGLDA